jgi:hypothetical protein
MTSEDNADIRRLTGACECGAVRYAVADTFRYAMNCHCSRCRAGTGSAFKAFAGIEREKLEIAEGSDSLLVFGEEDLNHTRCGVCGSLLFSVVRDGAYVHVALRTAERLAAGGIEASVLDLRTLAPLDREALLAVARHCSRVLIVHEDSRSGGIGESVAAIVQEEAFESLDAPVRIIGALDTPVPYSPPLEEFFLPSEAEIERAARLLVAY